MKWSLTIARVFGIRIRVHFTFLLLLLWIVVETRAAAGWGAAAWGVAFIVATFTCVALHELGHSVVAQRFGIRVSSITLLPIGGVAALRSIPQKPGQEIAITLAGPLVNVVIFAVLYVIAVWVPFEVPYYPGLMTLPELPIGVAELMGALLLVNKWMVVFNLIPAYPMDGGRLFRAVLAQWLSYPRATAIAAVVGRAFSIGFVALGLLTGWIFLAIIGVLIFFAAGAEEKTVRLHGALQDIEVGKVMTPVFMTVGPDDAAGDCLPWIFQRGQDDFPVMSDGDLMGMLTRGAVLEAAKQNGTARAADLMTRNFSCTRPDAQVAGVHDAMLANGQRTVPVIEDGRLVGLLTFDNINRYFMIHPSGAARKVT
ncbi:MAG: site-2 protease family protein [Verrucomicrobia bacterium]|nr:site-2 protease family protein [Verrucomicrobiota bacterium]